MTWLDVVLIADVATFYLVSLAQPTKVITRHPQNFINSQDLCISGLCYVLSWQSMGPTACLHTDTSVVGLLSTLFWARLPWSVHLWFYLTVMHSINGQSDLQNTGLLLPPCPYKTPSCLWHLW